MKTLPVLPLSPYVRFAVWLGFISLLMFELCNQRAHAQQPQGMHAPQKPAAYETRVYNVRDLLGPQNFPLLDQAGGTTILGRTTGNGSSTNSLPRGGFGGGQGGMGGMGGGSGGGMFRIPDHVLPQICGGMEGDMSSGGGDGYFGNAGDHLFKSDRVGGRAAAISIGTLISVIQSTAVYADENGARQAFWVDMDGIGGTIATVGSLLVISQLPDVHKQIEALIKDLRLQLTYDQPITVDLVIVETEKTLQEEVLLEELVTTPEARSVRLTVVNGQVSHLISGIRQRVLTGALPVVGGESPGYQPQSTVQALGIVWEVRCQVQPDSKRAELDFHLEILSPSLERPNDQFKITAELWGDRATAMGQQIATSLVAEQSVWKLAGSVPDLESGKNRLAIVRWK